MQPDWAKFATAIGEFREEAGEMVQFTLPVTELVYPPGTIIDPETGRPYDPTIEAENEAVNLVECTALVVRASVNAIREKDDVVNEAMGMIEEGEAVFIVAFADWSRLELERATEVRSISGNESGFYAVTQPTFDKTGGNGESDRVLIRGRMTSP